MSQNDVEGPQGGLPVFVSKERYRSLNLSVNLNCLTLHLIPVLRVGKIIE